MDSINKYKSENLYLKEQISIRDFNTYLKMVCMGRSLEELYNNLYFPSLNFDEKKRTDRITQINMWCKYLNAISINNSNRIDYFLEHEADKYGDVIGAYSRVQWRMAIKYGTFETIRKVIGDSRIKFYKDEILNICDKLNVNIKKKNKILKKLKNYFFLIYRKARNF